MSQNTENKTTPNWLLFLFFGTLVVGVMYAIFAHGFMNQDANFKYRQSADLAYEKPASAAIAFKSFPAHNAANIKDGEKNYVTYCAACHGATLGGGVGPDLKDSEWLHMTKVTEKSVAIRIIKGVTADQAKKGGVMPARGGSSLTNEQILLISYYLATKAPSIKKSTK